VSFYRVYRGVPNGTFRCRFTSPTPSWAGGDPDVPPPGGLFAYVVTAVNPAGQQSRPGIAGAGFVLTLDGVATEDPWRAAGTGAR